MIGLHRPLRKSRFHVRAATGACRSFPFSGGAHAVGGQRSYLQTPKMVRFAADHYRGVAPVRAPAYGSLI